jgi:hypothetical protein
MLSWQTSEDGATFNPSATRETFFFHLQRSPLLRGANFQRKDPVTFEVIEVNGRCEAVKLMTPKILEEEEKRAAGEFVDGQENGKCEPTELVGQRVEGAVQSQYQLMLKQKWGFVTSEAFAGKVFWHITESPDMQEVEFEREDVVEFDLVLDERERMGTNVRAKNMKYIRPRDQPLLRPKYLSEKKQRKKEDMMKNWRKGPPPDWDCKECGFHNFGRNKTCKNCGNGTRPPREEWAPEEEEGGPEHQPMVIPPPRMGGPLGDDPITQPGWLPETWSQNEPPKEEAYGNQSQQALEDNKSPFGGYEGNTQGKIDLLVSTFQDVFENHDPRRTGETMIFRLRALMQEVNEVLGQDRSSKHAFSMELAKFPWFSENGYEVRYQPSRNRLGISQRGDDAAHDEDAWGPQKRKVEDDWGW